MGHYYLWIQYGAIWLFYTIFTVCYTNALFIYYFNIDNYMLSWCTTEQYQVYKTIKLGAKLDYLPTIIFYINKTQCTYNYCSKKV